VNHDSAIDILAHHTDGGGLSDHVFAIMYLLGIRFQPRMSSPNDRRLYAFEAKGRYGVLAPFMGEPTGMALSTLRAAGEVRAPQFGSAEGDLDAEMVAIAGAIIRQRNGNFDPSTYRDRYQEALQQLIEAKTKGLTIKPRAVSTPSPVIDLMAALKRSLAQEPSAPEQETAKRRRTKQPSDRRQPALLLPLTGDRKRNQPPSTDWAVSRKSKGA